MTLVPRRHGVTRDDAILQLSRWQLAAEVSGNSEVSPWSCRETDIPPAQVVRSSGTCWRCAAKGGARKGIIRRNSGGLRQYTPTCGVLCCGTRRPYPAPCFQVFLLMIPPRALPSLPISSRPRSAWAHPSSSSLVIHVPAAHHLTRPPPSFLSLAELRNGPQHSLRHKVATKSRVL